MKRKFKKAKIDSIDQVKAGLYIRALITTNGYFSFSTCKLSGVPFKKTFHYSSIDYTDRYFCIKEQITNKIKDDSSIRDLIGHNETVQLFKFSSELYHYLSTLNVFSFLEFILERKLTLNEALDYTEKWGYARWYLDSLAFDYY